MLKYGETFEEFLAACQLFWKYWFPQFFSNHVRCFFTYNRFRGPVGYTSKMNNKFQVLTNIYVCIQYFTGFIFYENVVLLVRYVPVIWQFWIHKSQHNSHFLVFVRKLTFLKYSCQKNLEKKCGTQYFQKSWQAARNFSKVSLYFNKMPNF